MKNYPLPSKISWWRLPEWLEKLTTRVEVLEDAPAPPTPVAPYKVYTALLTQSGGDVPLQLLSQDSPSLTVGVTYQIDDDGGSGWDFTNVGAPNNDLFTYFIATGTTPANWGTNGMLSYNTGAPVVNVLEDTTGLNLYWTYLNSGVYLIQSSVMNNWTLEEKNFYKSKIAVFVNLPTRNDNDNSFTVTAGYYADGPEFFVTTGDGSETINDVLSDVDGWLRTSLEIRVYN